MEYQRPKITVYQEEPPVFMEGTTTEFLVSFCTDNRLLLLDNPEIIMDFTKYTVRTANGRLGMLLHYSDATSEMIIFEVENFL